MTQMTQWPPADRVMEKTLLAEGGRAGPAAIGQQKRTGYEQFFIATSKTALKIFFLVE